MLPNKRIHELFEKLINSLNALRNPDPTKHFTSFMISHPEADNPNNLIGIIELFETLKHLLEIDIKNNKRFFCNNCNANVVGFDFISEEVLKKCPEIYKSFKCRDCSIKSQEDN